MSANTRNVVWAAMPPTALETANPASPSAAPTAVVISPGSDVAAPSNTAPASASPRLVRSANSSTILGELDPGRHQNSRPQCQCGDSPFRPNRSSLHLRPEPCDAAVRVVEFYSTNDLISHMSPIPRSGPSLNKRSDRCAGPVCVHLALHLAQIGEPRRW